MFSSSLQTSTFHLPFTRRGFDVDVAGFRSSLSVCTRHRAWTMNCARGLMDREPGENDKVFIEVAELESFSFILKHLVGV